MVNIEKRVAPVSVSYGDLFSEEVKSKLREIFRKSPELSKHPKYSNLSDDEKVNTWIEKVAKPFIEAKKKRSEQWTKLSDETKQEFKNIIEWFFFDMTYDSLAKFDPEVYWFLKDANQQNRFGFIVYQEKDLVTKKEKITPFFIKSDIRDSFYGELFARLGARIDLQKISSCKEYCIYDFSTVAYVVSRLPDVESEFFDKKANLGRVISTLFNFYNEKVDGKNALSKFFEVE